MANVVVVIERSHDGHLTAFLQGTPKQRREVEIYLMDTKLVDHWTFEPVEIYQWMPSWAEDKLRAYHEAHPVKGAK